MRTVGKKKFKKPTYLSVITTNVESPCRKIVFLNKFHSRHKPSDSDVVWTVLKEKETGRPLHVQPLISSDLYIKQLYHEIITIRPFLKGCF